MKKHIKKRERSTMTQIAARITRANADVMKKLAHRHHCTLSDVVRAACTEFVNAISQVKEA